MYQLRHFSLFDHHAVSFGKAVGQGGALRCLYLRLIFDRIYWLSGHFCCGIAQAVRSAIGRAVGSAELSDGKPLVVR